MTTERIALITREQVALVLEEAESAELDARAFSQDRARQRRPYGLHACSVIPFPKTMLYLTNPLNG
jgi:hypothetical protein